MSDKKTEIRNETEKVQPGPSNNEGAANVKGSIPSNAPQEFQNSNSPEMARPRSAFDYAKSFLAYMWPWSSASSSGPSDSGTVESRKNSRRASLMRTEAPNSADGLKKDISSGVLPTKTESSGIKPRKSDKKVEESTSKQPQETESKVVSNLFTNIKWPWSSEPSSDEAQESPTGRKDSNRMSTPVVNFTKNPNEKILSITPWGSKPENDGKEIKAPTKKCSEPTHMPQIPPHNSLPGLRPQKSKEDKHVKTIVPGPSNRHNAINNDDTLSSPDSSNSGGSTTALLDELHLLDVPIPEHLRAPEVESSKSPESNWATAFHQLASIAGENERYDPITIKIFRDKEDHANLNSDSSNDSISPSAANLASKSDATHSKPFLYNQRPFRMPQLANRKEDLEVGSVDNIFQFDPIRVDSIDWSSIHPGNETQIAATKWALPEPIRADKRLLPEVDPLVKYKLKRLGKNRVTPEELLKTQEELALGISPSGRKLNGYISGSGDECTYKRVLCKNDSDFDILEPYIETESGEKWSHPFLHYWNWKQTDEHASENYLHHQRRDRDNDLAQKRKIAVELEKHPTKIPRQNLGADDTDYEDPLGPLASAPVALFVDTFHYFLKTPKYMSRRGRKQGAKDMGAEALQDPVYQRYYYVLMHEYSAIYKKYHNFRLFRRAQKRALYRAMMSLLGKYTSTSLTINTYPAWFYVWKIFFRHVVRRVPRKYKFCKRQNIETVFYGTFASIYATQYIVEYDLLPNMDDPVKTSQLALEKALEIKEEFFTEDNSGKPFVDYVKMQKSKIYEEYLEWIGLLCRYQPIKMPPRVRKAFFLNYFNVLSIQSQIIRIPDKEHTSYLWEMKDFWCKTTGLAGFMELSLDQIYHGILRCNRMHPTKQVKMFEEHQTSGLPKEMCPTRLSLDWLDPRIHFALNIGCKSCPPIHSFSLYEQDYQLDEVAKTYVRNKIKINVHQRIVTLPILFLWYERDFGNNKYIMLWYLKQFMWSQDMLKMRQLLSSKKPIKLRYERFNYEIEHEVQRHPVSKGEPATHQKIIPMYWGSRF